MLVVLIDHRMLTRSSTSGLGWDSKECTALGLISLQSGVPIGRLLYDLQHGFIFGKV